MCSCTVTMLRKSVPTGCCDSHAAMQRRCLCPIEVADTVRRTVCKLICCVDHESDMMTVLRRQRSISGSLGTAQKPVYRKALPLLRCVAAMVSVLSELVIL